MRILNFVFVFIGTSSRIENCLFFFLSTATLYLLQQFGEIDYVRMLQDRKTGKTKNLAYVKYFKQYDAAKAVEECGSGEC